MSTIYLRTVETNDAVDLPSSLDDFNIIYDDDGGPTIALAKEPDTGVPTLVILPNGPLLVLTSGATGMNYQGKTFPSPYRPLRVRREKLEAGPQQINNLL